MLTIVVPTGGRGEFLVRMLRYAAHLRFPWTIIIADDGSEVDRQATARMVQEFSGALSLVHQQYPQKIELVAKIGRALDVVKTPFAVLGADDDFFLPQGLHAAVDWLQKNPDYSLAHGSAVVFHLKSGLVHGELELVAPYRAARLRTTDSHRAVKISSQAILDHVVLRGRTEHLCYNWQTAAGLKLDLRFGEIVPSALSVIQGKVKLLPCFFMARQGHDLRVSESYAGKELKWVSNPTWVEQDAAHPRLFVSAFG